MKRIFIIKCILLSAICTFAQIENYISDNIYQNCDKKCYVLIKIPEVIYKEIKDDSMVTARINEESRTLLREIGQKEIAVINNNQLDTIKYCNSAILLVNVKNYTKKGGRIGLAAGAVIVNFIYFKNVNNVKSDKETEITGTGQAVWGDLNVFYQLTRMQLINTMTSLLQRKLNLNLLKGKTIYLMNDLIKSAYRDKTLHLNRSDSFH